MREYKYHSCYIVFQYVMMKIIKCVYIHVIKLIRYRRKCWCETFSIKCYFYFKVTCKNKLFISKQFTYESVTKQDLRMSPHSVKPISSCDYRLHLKQKRKKCQFSRWVIQFIPSQCNGFFNVHVFSKLNFVITGFFI